MEHPPVSPQLLATSMPMALKVALSMNPFRVTGQSVLLEDNRWLYNNLIFINKWKLGINSGIVGKDGTNKQIKKYFLKKYNNSCQKCGWGEINIHTGNVPLALHHIDGNSKNNREENLELLCPNCHSLTDNYGSTNKNCTRTYRNEYRK